MAKTIFTRAEISEMAYEAYKKAGMKNSVILAVDYYKINGKARRILTVKATGEQFIMNDKTKCYTRYKSIQREESK